MDKYDYIEAFLEIVNNYEKYSMNSYDLCQKYDNVHRKFLKRLSDL